MANLKSSKKSIQNTIRNHDRNVAIVSKVKTAIKKSLHAISANDENKAELLKAAQKEIDKAVTKGVLHKRTAARRKSRLALKFNKIQKPETKKADAPKKRAVAAKKKVVAKKA